MLLPQAAQFLFLQLLRLLLPEVELKKLLLEPIELLLLLRFIALTYYDAAAEEASSKMLSPGFRNVLFLGEGGSPGQR